jgi:hypothetical protein
MVKKLRSGFRINEKPLTKGYKGNHALDEADARPGRLRRRQMGELPWARIASSAAVPTPSQLLFDTVRCDTATLGDRVMFECKGQGG